MTASDVSEVASMLSKTNVKSSNELSFAGRKLKLDTAKDAQEIVDGIKNFQDLKALCLEGNTLGLEAAKVIAKALEEKSKFEKALWSDMYTGRLRSEIPPSLEYLGNGIITAGARLSELDLSDNAFGPDGVKGIKKLLISEACYSLQTLKLNNNGLGIGGGKILSEAFISCHKSSVAAGKPFALKVFISGRNRLENEGAKALSEAFKLLGSLEEITMPQNGIRPEGVSYLAAAFQENKNLKVVNINDNTCTESGAKALAQCVPHLKRLEILNVGDCLLKDKGAVALAPALAVDLPHLKQVIMSFNEIRRDGAIAVAKSMKNKDKLEILNLDGNQLGDSTDEVQDVMSSINRIDTLAPFDDNEDPDSDEDENEEEEGEVVEQDEEEADDLLSQIKSMGLSKDLSNDTVKTNGESTKAATTDDIRAFFSAPTLVNWRNIPSNGRKERLQTVVEEELLPSTATVARVYVESCCALHDDQDLEELADAILGTALADSRCLSDELVNQLLIMMGLIKAEVKVEKVDNLRGPLTGLASIISQEYFPRNIVSTFIAFFMKPNTLLDRCSTERHTVLQKLHQK